MFELLFTHNIEICFHAVWLDITFQICQGVVERNWISKIFFPGFYNEVKSFINMKESQLTFIRKKCLQVKDIYMYI